MLQMPMAQKPTTTPRLIARMLPLAMAAAVAACAPAGLGLDGLTGAVPPLETSSIAATDPAAKPTARSSGPAVTSAIEEARRLRLAGDLGKALRLLDAAAEKAPADKALMMERGLVALEAGQVKRSEALLRQAFDPAAADWRLNSALGSALAAQGKQAEAQLQFAKALEIMPDHPSVLNNLALSYALDGKHEEAEQLLKRVTRLEGAEPKAKQNLALLLGLKGKVGEAQRISEAVLPPDKARVNVSYLESLRAGGERATVSRAHRPEEPAVAVAAEGK